MKDLTDKIDLKAENALIIEKGKKLAFGGNCEFYRPQALEELYGRKNLGLKLFVRAWEKHNKIPIEKMWTEAKMREIAIIHNILAFQDLAPRVYDIVKIGNNFALIVEFLEGAVGFTDAEEANAVYKNVRTRGEELGIENITNEERADNYINGKIIDLNSCTIDLEAYEKKILHKIQDTQEVGAGGFQSYQIFDKVPGKRNTDYRVKKMKLDEDDYNGKTVLDLGCSIGAFCQEAAKRGAKRIFGFDYKHVCETAREFANLKGYYNIDFIPMELCRYPEQVYEDIKKATGLERFDIIFYLSMERWIGIQPWIYESFNDVLYCEEHPGGNRIEIPKDLRTIELGMLELEPWDTNRRITKSYT